MLADPSGTVLPWELLPTRVVLAIGGGIPNRNRSPVKGTGGGCCASGCHVCGSEYWSSLLEAGDDIVDWERCVSPVGPWDSPSVEESDSLQKSADLLSVDEREEDGGGGGGGNSNGYA